MMTTGSWGCSVRRTIGAMARQIAAPLELTRHRHYRSFRRLEVVYLPR
jgi:hypothetical protein